MQWIENHFFEREEQYDLDSNRYEQQLVALDLEMGMLHQQIAH